jgi:hypothetical protein
MGFKGGQAIIGQVDDGFLFSLPGARAMGSGSPDMGTQDARGSGLS